ncbi:MAG: hypothetical protein RR233_09485, partial [Clostridiales bacterium]
ESKAFLTALHLAKKLCFSKIFLITHYWLGYLVKAKGIFSVLYLTFSVLYLNMGNGFCLVKNMEYSRV